MKYLCSSTQRIRGWLNTSLDAVHRWWTNHCTRMAHEIGYADALVAVTLAAVELLTDSHRARYLTRGLAAAYVVILRALSPHDDWEEA